MRVQRLATVPVFAEIVKVWGAISPTPLVRLASDFGFGAVGSQIAMLHVYQISLKSESVGFKFSVILGDLTRSDPLADLTHGVPTPKPCYGVYYRPKTTNTEHTARPSRSTRARDTSSSSVSATLSDTASCLFS